MRTREVSYKLIAKSGRHTHLHAPSIADLEINTEAELQPPTVSIIAPTPRAFTFPINTGPFPPSHVSPFSSPSASPFEPETRSPITPVSTPPLVRTYTPSSELSSPTSSSLYSPSSHWRRRKSSTGSAITESERRPKKGDGDYIKRPENAFILFRRKCVEDRLQAATDEAETSGSGEKTKVKKQRQADLSKMISQQWKALSAEEKSHWEDLAKQKKKEHEEMYPNYVYRPQRVKKSEKAKAATKKGKGAAREGEHEELGSMTFVLPVPPHQSSARHSRSVSAPTPPLMYQTIQLPHIPFMPSCPSSPTLGPAPPIRRSSIDRTPRPTELRSYDSAPQPVLAMAFAAPMEYPSHIVSFCHCGCSASRQLI
jgi:hypothetical protein